MVGVEGPQVLLLCLSAEVGGTDGLRGDNSKVSGRQESLPPGGGKDRMGVHTAMCERSRRLRREMTPHEKILWGQLRRQAFGCRFRRQHVFGRYIVDFVCLQHRLIIEVDGDQHLDQRKYDEERTRWLNQQGYRVLRFTNTPGPAPTR